MSFFKNILSKLGIGEDKEEESKPAPAKISSRPTRSARTAGKPDLAKYKPTKSKMPMVDVLGKLESLAAANPEKLNWKVSIVDLLKLLEIDSSYQARKELATELKCPADVMSDSTKMSIWLHKNVMQEIANNGGNVPKELLD